MDYAYDVYYKAIPALEGEFITPARLHEIVGENIKDLLQARGDLPPEGVRPGGGGGTSFRLQNWLNWLASMGIPVVVGD